MTDPADGRRPPVHARFTSRAAVLAIVICAIALSLAYPVREYLSERRQIDQLEAQRQEINVQVKQLQAQQQQLDNPAYVGQQAQDRLHMCLPSQTCYVIIGRTSRAGPAAAGPASASPWYKRVWSSVERADGKPAR
jgi:cell division protein FtsB